jgi:hypothetical protein
MEAKIYESKRRVTLKDGTVREYTNRRVYTPKNKEVKKSEITDLIRRIDDQIKLKSIKEYIIKVNAGEVGNDNIQGE